MAQKEIEGSMKFPLLPLRDVTLFPQMVTGIEVGRPQSVAAARGDAGRRLRGLRDAASCGYGQPGH